MELVIEKDQAKITPLKKVEGEISPCPDKSITHRAIMLASLAKGTSRVRNYLPADDCLATVDAFCSLGIEIKSEGKDLIIQGKGLRGLSAPSGKIDLRNSGTTMRLLSGILSGQSFSSELDGDASLRRRPMKRIVQPLSLMGAKIEAREGNYPPLKIFGRYPLKAIKYHLPVPSAQVKSAILFATLYAEGETIIEEDFVSRDHTERLFKFFGLPLKQKGKEIIFPGQREDFSPQDLEVVGDISGAAFFIALGLLLPNSQILIRQVGVNPTRIGLLKVLEKMGAKIKKENEREITGEPLCDLKVFSSSLKGVIVEEELIPQMIDEIPILSLLATQAQGETIIKGVGELRYKESNRLEAIVSNFSRMGAEIKAVEDNLYIQGGKELKGTVVDSFFDHRIAMSLVIAGLVAGGETTIKGVDCIKISFPNFWEVLNLLT